MKEKNSIWSVCKRTFFNVREIGVIIPLIVFTIFFAVKNPLFLGRVNLINIARTSAYTLIGGVGMSLLLITGCFDIAAGSKLMFAGTVAGLVLQKDMSIFAAFVIGLLVIAVFGIVQGWCIIKVDIPPYIAGLGFSYILQGIVLVVTNGAPVYPLPEEFNNIGVIMFLNDNVPLVVVIALALALVASFILRFTSYGRKIYAVGGNAEVARLSGIKVERIRYSVFAISSVCFGLAGILTAARINSAQSTAGTDFPTTVISSCVIGGVSLFGGAGSILATVLGSIFITTITNGMTISGVNPYYQKLVLGLVLVISVGFDRWRSTRKA